MSDVTKILSQIESGDPSAAEQLLPLVYDELRKLAVAKLAQEKPGQTLQATAIVHEAYLRLVDTEQIRHIGDVDSNRNRPGNAFVFIVIAIKVAAEQVVSKRSARCQVKPLNNRARDVQRDLVDVP